MPKPLYVFQACPSVYLFTTYGNFAYKTVSLCNVLHAEVESKTFWQTRNNSLSKGEIKFLQTLEKTFQLAKVSVKSTVVMHKYTLDYNF